MSSLWNFLKEAAPVVAAVASATSARAALKTARKASAATKESTHAVAMVLRPAFVLAVPVVANTEKPGVEVVELENMAAFAATDGYVEVRSKDGHWLTSRTFTRVPGQMPNTIDMGGASIVRVEVPLPPMLKVGDTQEFIATVRFSDERQLERWEQEIKVRRERVEPTVLSPEINIKMRTSRSEIRSVPPASK